MPRNTPPNKLFASSHGKLTAAEGEYAHDPTLPKLQFDDGDLLIKLGRDSIDWLLVHSAVVAAICPVLGVGSSLPWSESSKLEIITHPSTGKSVNVRTLALNIVEGTFLLEGKTFDITPASATDAIPFQSSSLSEGSWPDYCGVYPSDALHWTVRALRVFFALIYGAKLEPDALCGYREEKYFGTTQMNGGVVAVVGTVCSYAQYYQCFDYVKPLIVEAMQSGPGYWGAVAYAPWMHLKLARRLQLADVYHDCLRHIIAKAHHDGEAEDAEVWNDLSAEMGVAPDQIRSFFLPQLDGVYGRIDQLELDLMKVQLSPVEAFYNNSYMTKTTFANVLQFLKPRRPATTKASEGAEFLARAMFGQCFVQQLHGDEVARAEKGRLRTKPKSRLNLAVQKITSAAKTRSPAPVFGGPTPGRIIDVFNLASWFKSKSSEPLQSKLMMIIDEAYDIILGTFPESTGLRTCDYPFKWPESYDLGRAGRARYDAHIAGYFTWMWMPDVVAWEFHSTSFVEQPVLRPEVNMADASEAWMSLLHEHLSDGPGEEEHDLAAGRDLLGMSDERESTSGDVQAREVSIADANAEGATGDDEHKSSEVKNDDDNED
ncbi:hypothetical protein Q7P37_002310 [Cladosporium fusiforme]